MYKNVKLVVAAALLILLSACYREKRINLLSGSKDLVMTSVDTALVSIFNWARNTSGSYVGSDNDPVGPWYEAALPGREAFCIRDVSHQCIGAEIQGQSKQNLNMFRKFVVNISESKDYCSYWEINRYDKPAPVDYSSDSDFWYNLNANFDIIDACYKLFEWTGDTTYISDKSFDEFFKLTLNQYIERWQLQPEKIMSRPPFMNLKPGTVKYRNARGIPSYDESQDDLTVSSDLLGMICNGFRKYSEILAIRGDKDLSSIFAARAESYFKLIDSLWWDGKMNGYHGFYRSNRQFSEGGVSNSEFLLWYGIISDPQRIEKSLRDLVNSQVEVLSYMPMLFYRYGFPEEGYTYLKKIFNDKRRMYPEASSGAIEGIVRGMMGIEPSASKGIIVSCPHLAYTIGWVQVENIPVFSGLVSLRHHSNTMTTFANKSGKQVTWRACFTGKHEYIKFGNVPLQGTVTKDPMGNPVTYIDIIIKPGEQATAAAI